MNKNDPWTENDQVDGGSKIVGNPTNLDTSRAHTIPCKCCGKRNAGKYYKYHVGRRLREGEDYLEEQAYRDISYSGGGSVTTYFLKAGEGQEFICNECLNNELKHGKYVVKGAVGELMAIELSGDRNKYESCIPDYFFKSFVKPGSNCFIATACYGDYNCDEVRSFREFRDVVLLSCNLGKKIVLLYYNISPKIATWISCYSWRRYFVKYTLLVPALVFSRVVTYVVSVVRNQYNL